MEFHLLRKMMLMYDDVKIANRSQVHNVMGKTCSKPLFSVCKMSVNANDCPVTFDEK